MTSTTSTHTTLPPKFGEPRSFRPHLNRLREALKSVGIDLPSAKIQTMAAAFYGFGSINALAAALKRQDVAIPEAITATGQESLLLMRDPLSGRVFGVDPEFTADFFVTPYGSLVRPTALPKGQTRHPGEGDRAMSLRMARRGFRAYAGREIAHYEDEATVASLIADLLRFHQNLPKDEPQGPLKSVVDVAESALRHYQRECLGEVSGLDCPDIMVSIETLDWDTAWTDSRASVEAAVRAYAPNSVECEPDYISGDMICDLLHMTAAVDHASPIDALRSGLAQLDRNRTVPQVSVYTRVGR